MNPVERNDIDISRLFNWGSEFDVVDKNGKSAGKVYIRLLGDADQNRARVYALRKSAEYRKLLRDPNSDERLALIPNISEEEKEVVINILTSLNVKDVTNRAIREVRVPLPKELKSNSNLEDQEKYQEEVDNYPNKRQSEIRAFIEKELEKIRSGYNAMPLDKLISEYERLIINQLCEAKSIEGFRNACVVYGTYKDPEYKNRLFKSIDEYENTLPDIKEQLANYYDSLDVGMEELKN